MTEQVSYFYVAGWDESTPETRDILTKRAIQNAPGKVVEGRDSRELEQSQALSERQFSEAWGDLQQLDERQSVIDIQQSEIKALEAKIDSLTQPTAPPAPALTAATPVTEAIPVVDAKKSPPRWLVVTGAYVVNVMREGKCATAKNTFHLLESKTVIDGSPFELGAGAGRGCLYVTEINKNVSLKTFQNAWTEIKNITK